MLKSYEALYENGQVKWLTEQPEINSARIIVTVLEDASNVQKLKAKQAAQALAKLGGSEPRLKNIPRRRSEPQNADHG